MSNLDVLCIVAAGGTVGGLLMWLAWTFGYMTGTRAVSDHWQDSIVTDAAIKEEFHVAPANDWDVTPAPTKEFHVTPKPEHLPSTLYTPAPVPIPDCNCGGLCPSCALERGISEAYVPIPDCNCGGLCPSCALERGISEAYGVK